jgi:hypothetical protein
LYVIDTDLARRGFLPFGHRVWLRAMPGRKFIATAFPFGKAVWLGCYAAIGLEALILEKVECTTSAASSFGVPSIVPDSILSTSL